MCQKVLRFYTDKSNQCRFSLRSPTKNLHLRRMFRGTLWSRTAEDTAKRYSIRRRYPDQLVKQTVLRPSYKHTSCIEMYMNYEVDNWRVKRSRVKFPSPWFGCLWKSPNPIIVTYVLRQYDCYLFFVLQDLMLSN